MCVVGVSGEAVNIYNQSSTWLQARTYELVMAPLTNFSISCSTLKFCLVILSWGAEYCFYNFFMYQNNFPMEGLSDLTLLEQTADIFFVFLVILINFYICLIMSIRIISLRISLRISLIEIAKYNIEHNVLSSPTAVKHPCGTGMSYAVFNL